MALNAPKLRVLLAALLISGNQTLSIDQLAERLWGELPPSTARKAIQLYVLRLRRLLGDDTAGPSSLIVTRPDGYLIRLAPDQLDLYRFTTLTESAKEAARAGDLTAELSYLTEALACWRGPALSDVPSESLQREVVAQLAETRLRATERRMQVALDLGRHREIISELVQLTKDHPWQEPFWVQLILALQRSDRLADALDTYRTVHRMFREDLGIDPGEQLQQLHGTLLAGPAEPLPDKEPDRFTAQICQLPAGVRGFVGREGLVEKLNALLTEDGDTADAVVVSGPPGVGKTALALHVAHRLRPLFGDGQLYVNLQGFAADPPLSPGAVLTRFLRALGVPREHVPSDQEDQAALYRSLLAGRNMLVLLDNAAHPEQVRPLLPGQSGCAVLITSRNDLRGLTASEGVVHVPLGVLTPAQARAVLADLVGVDRAAAEPDALDTLARTCAHLPLALRIAGANLAADPHRTISGYTHELTGSGRVGQLAIDGDERSAVRVAFDRSYLSLSEEDRHLFRLLGLVPGADLTAAAAAALTEQTPPVALRALDRLTAANLLHRHAPGRYQFHDLIREYAADRAQDEDIPAALTRIFDFYLHTADAATRMLYPGVARLPRPEAEPVAAPATDAAALRWLDDERSNLFAAVTRAASSPPNYRYAWLLVDVLRGYLQARGDAGDVLAGCEAALVAAGKARDHQAEISVLDILGMIFYNISDYQRAIGYHYRALHSAKQIKNLDAEARALHNLGRVYTQRGQCAQAEECHLQALELSRRSGNRDEECLALNYIGVALTSAGRPATALDWHRQSLELSQEIGNREATYRALNGLGITHWALGELDKAIDCHEQVLAYCREIGQVHGETASLNCLAEANCDAGNYELAMLQATESIGRCIQLGDRRGEAGALEVIATVRDRTGEHAAAIEPFTAALRIAREISFGYGEISILIGLASAHRNLGDAGLALSHAQQAMAKLTDTGLVGLEATALIELANDYQKLGEHCEAQHHIDRAVEAAKSRGQRLVYERAALVREAIAAGSRREAEL